MTSLLVDLARQQLDCGKYCLIPKRHWTSFLKKVKICHVDFKNHWRSFLLSLGDPDFQLSIHYIQDHYHQECKLCVFLHQYRLEFWVWASSRSWWTTGKPGVLQSMGSDTAELLNNNRRALDCLTKMNNRQDTWNLENSCFCKPFLCCTKKQFFLFMHDWQLFSEVHFFEILDSSKTTLINLEEIHGHLNTQPRWPGPVSHIQGIFTHTEEPLGASPQRLF